MPLIAELWNGTIGVAPYYLIAFELGGIPTTTPLGSDPTNMTWTANHKAGALSRCPSDVLE